MLISPDQVSHRPRNRKKGGLSPLFRNRRQKKVTSPESESAMSEAIRPQFSISPRTYYSLTKVAVMLIASLPLSHGLPLFSRGAQNGFESTTTTITDEPPLSTGQFYMYMIISSVLVLLGGVFAGLTLGLMGQDEVNLNVILQSSESLAERENARKVLHLLKRGKHWVLVTLLLSNVITNESLPIVLDRVLGGGWPAVVCSTIAIVIFGEVIPQSVCVRYGLSIGAWLSPYVLGLMYVMYPVAYPTAKLLDHLLGEDHGTIYKKAGLKTLVNLHHTMGVNAERLNEDEVTIITAVLDLKAKPVGSIMTPLEDVYTMSADRILDEITIDKILSAGFSRIPIHQPGEPTNYIGMLLVRILISYDPEDALPVSSFPLATLPETRPDTSCLNILNYFQEGKSHMIIVSDTPGESTGALGILTLEDVIEELIGEEIIDESDVFIDIHRAIRRTQPGPLSKRVTFNQYVHNQHSHDCNHPEENDPDDGNDSLSILTLGSKSDDPKYASIKNTRKSTPPLVKSHSYLNSFPHSNSQLNNSEMEPLLGMEAPTPTTTATSSLLNPKNPAANPIMTSNSKVTIKKIPDGTFTKPQARKQGGGAAGNQYGVVTPTYLAVPGNQLQSLTPHRRQSIEIGARPNLDPSTYSPSPQVAIVHESEQDALIDGFALTRRLNAHNGVYGSVDENLAMSAMPMEIVTGVEMHTIPPPLTSLSAHSYLRTGGGIIESVINVQGVSKTIIEDDDHLRNNSD